MKTVVAIGSLLLLGACGVYEGAVYQDPIYGSVQPQPRKTIQESEKPKQPTAESSSYYDPNTGNNNVTNNYYGDYNDLSYSSRLNRFYNPSIGFGYYSPFYSGFGMSYGYPYSGWSLSLGYGWGNPYYGGFGWYDPWYYGYGWPYYGNYGYYNGYYNGFYNGYYLGYYNEGLGNQRTRMHNGGVRGGLNHGYSGGGTRGGGNTRPATNGGRLMRESVPTNRQDVPAERSRETRPSMSQPRNTQPSQPSDIPKPRRTREGQPRSYAQPESMPRQNEYQPQRESRPQQPVHQPRQEYSQPSYSAPSPSRGGGSGGGSSPARRPR